MENKTTSELKEKVQSLLEQGILVSPDMLASGDPLDTQANAGDACIVLGDKDVAGSPSNPCMPAIAPAPDVRVIPNHPEAVKKRELQDFVDFFNSRYKAIESILRNRRELQGLTSIGRLKRKEEREEVAIIGMISDKQVTKKNKHLLLTIEDPTGTINVLVNKDKQELHEIAKDSVHDEVIGVTGVLGDKILFANSIILPEVPIHKELKKNSYETYVMFLSDLHIGSNNFLDEEFKKFLGWLNGDTSGGKQLELVSKIKYIFILGDLVEGVGVYPEQQSELIIKDIYDQYKACAEYLKQIPRHIKIVIIPGNHDAVRNAEPQPQLYEDLAAPIWALPNVIMLTNPARVNILSTPDFSGFDFLLYHGYSFTYYADNVESIRQKGGVDRADLIMKYLLQRRHLAPANLSTLYIPNPTGDSLVIDKIPDFFVTGHLHKTIVANYKNVTMISGSCWQSKTSFMEKLGIHPEPARVPLVNLQTREIRILRFGK